MPTLRVAGGTCWGAGRPPTWHSFLPAFGRTWCARNTFPQISPSLYYAARRAGVPVVQTLHNFRPFCMQAMLPRDGKVCEDCTGKLPWRGVVLRCYSGSFAQSAVLLGPDRDGRTGLLFEVGNATDLAAKMV